MIFRINLNVCSFAFEPIKLILTFSNLGKYYIAIIISSKI